MREAQAAGVPPGIYEASMTAVADYADLTEELLDTDTTS
jgi:hypothetical protein